MELWIRSQDKSILTKANNLCIVEHRVQVEIRAEIYGVFSQIATYKTKERALEVLDEIQNLMTPKVRFKSIISTKKLEKYKSEVIPLNPTIVYEMPKE